MTRRSSGLSCGPRLARRTGSAAYVSISETQSWISIRSWSISSSLLWGLALGSWTGPVLSPTTHFWACPRRTQASQGLWSIHYVSDLRAVARKLFSPLRGNRLP
ncbi:hypothetical protein BDV32DRAFT_119042 [Aspergillus pseudonomiae]|nr:hypothetical protein BDV32DRAFT_119042 [Aspergillus pseudonomiae]